MQAHEQQFRAKIDEALATVKTVLDVNRNPAIAADVPHTYDDKYRIAEYLSRAAMVSHINVLELLGLTAESLATLKKWSDAKIATLCFSSVETCSFLKEVKKEVDSKTKHVSEYENNRGGKISLSSKVVSTIIEYYYTFTVKYSLLAYAGTNQSQKVVLKEQTSTTEVMTTSKNRFPYPESYSVTHELDLAFLLKYASENGHLNFVIDREDDKCHTPRRNPQIISLLKSFNAFSQKCSEIRNYFINHLFPIQRNTSFDMGSLFSSKKIFVPVLPLLEESLEILDEAMTATSAETEEEATLGHHPQDDRVSEAMLSISDARAFVAEERRSLQVKMQEIASVLPDDDSLIIPSSAAVVVLMDHLVRVASFYSEGVQFIEGMLRSQLISALGKVVGPPEFAEYMRFHNRKIFKEEYQPSLLSYAIRRPDHFPEGLITIEAQSSDGKLSQPLLAISNKLDKCAPMSFPLNAASDVVFNGDRYLHACIQHQFAGDTGSNLTFIARARQFSSFILLIGRVVSATVFEPTMGIIIKNKDELKVALMMETIPTPKEFADAIESLSPEQQRFAKAFRSMQLESTLFGVCVIQIKPQLEKLLNLPDDSLTKELELTNELMDLFIQYHIPSDLVSYDGDEYASVLHKIGTVKEYVSRVRQLINEQKGSELEDLDRELEFAKGASIEDIMVELEVEKKCNERPALKHKKKKSKLSSRSSNRAKPSIQKSTATTTTTARTPAPAPSPSPPTPTTPVDAAPPSSDSPDKVPSLDVTIDEELDMFDFSKVPHQLDEKFATLDIDNALRPTIINLSAAWTRTQKKTLLSKEVTAAVSVDEQRTEKNTAYDLLDALTRSGCLPINAAEFHVVIAATHCFAKNLMDCVIEDNINPIEKVERSTLIMATTVFDASAEQLLKEGEVERVRTYSPILFEDSQ